MDAWYSGTDCENQASSLTHHGQGLVSPVLLDITQGPDAYKNTKEAIHSLHRMKPTKGGIFVSGHTWLGFMPS
ncbi:unnamed protein product [Protopolystoma xenopodis]|uniref:Uncharacterized protein n=1 Tax=Protopolystoma xenopodis TaxID=117903 RepID=A0A448X3R6_9PLAT|nr:unnamed protein product [Protopolystoma xenopodis]